MHKIQRLPAAFKHRRYYIEALPCGLFRWNIWRPNDQHLCGVNSLREAREAIAEDLAELQEVEA
jgi:hypothetical protein